MATIVATILTALIIAAVASPFVFLAWCVAGLVKRR
jgi:hypothetical protein